MTRATVLRVAVTGASRGEQRTFAATSASIGSTRRFVRGHVERVTGDRDRIADIELVTSELVTNAVEHGDDHQVTVAVRTAVGAIVLSVTSSGSTTALGEPASWAEPLPGDRSGRGLAIVRAVSDRVTVDVDEAMLTVNCQFDLDT